VIPPGIDPGDYGGYTGEVPSVLRVGNAMRARNLMFDVDFQERVCAGLPNRVVGEDPLIPEARPSASFEDLLDSFRTMRCLLHVTREEYEDGYNLSMLEAMACGMPVVALANRTSPLTDGVDGFVSKDGNVLRARLEQLLEDPALARELGARGRETVARTFPLELFVERWRQAIEETAQEGPRRASAKAPRARQTNVLLHYVASPITTGRYVEEALRRRHRVTTAGLRCPEEVLKGWGFREPIPPYPPHDIDLGLEAGYAELQARLEGRPAPQVYLWVDSGLRKVAPDIDRLTIPKVCYLIDTHVDLASRIEVARHFDFVFLAQRAQIPDFRAAGIGNVHWLPLACSRDLHALPPQERIYDIAYVGSLSDASDRRRRLMEGLRARFPNSRIGRFWPHEMARIYAQARIVVNACVNRDVNMRVFEALASGALLITDPAEGLEDLFEDGKHLVVYRRDEDLPDQVERYLADAGERERIAAAGRAEVLARHTYDHRIESMLETISKAPAYAAPDAAEFEAGGYYGSARPEVLQHVPKNARRILDCGCGSGEFGRALKSRGAAEVVGVEMVEGAWERARKVLDRALLGNIETIELPFDEGYFDCACFNDVLEHLVDPAAALRKVARVLAPGGVVVMSIPNVRFCSVLGMLAEGRWKYEDAGILDRTHLRFFTAADFPEVVHAAGLEVLKIEPLSMLDPARLPRRSDGSVRMGRMMLHDVDDRDYRDLLTYQYLVVAGKPGVHRLAAARQALEEGNDEEAYALAESAADGCDRFEQRRIMAKAVARLGKLDSAERLYREALEMRADPAVAGELGLVLVAMGRTSEARPLLEDAAEADDHDDRARGGLGIVAWAEGESWEAYRHFLAALEVNPDNPTVVSHAIEAGRALGQMAEVEPYVRRFVELHPGNLDMLCRHAELLFGLGRSGEAQSQLETVLLLAPDHEPAHRLLAQLQR
jgi:glycosyltransferase involved in cell wall biosynthesis/ubiquinone/menaquinone biosynthesis C-methylase UbiE/Flp pilus assembly protein TadD